MYEAQIKTMNLQICGKLGECYGTYHDFTLETDNPLECMRALECNFPGFLTQFDKLNYSLIRINESAETGNQVCDQNDILVPGDRLILMPQLTGDIAAAVVAALGITAGTVAAAVVTVIVNVI